MGEIGGRPVEVLVFAVIVGFLIGCIAVVFVRYVMM
jgi:hypothetical protein